MQEINKQQDQTLGNLSSLLIAAIICLAVQILFSILGTAIGLSTWDGNSLDLKEKSITFGVGIYAFLAIFLSFFIGGWTAANMAFARRKSDLILYSIGVWAIVILSLFLFIGDHLLPEAGMVMTKADSLKGNEAS